jgi:hypothetical protein
MWQKEKSALLSTWLSPQAHSKDWHHIDSCKWVAAMSADYRCWRRRNAWASTSSKILAHEIDSALIPQVNQQSDCSRERNRLLQSLHWVTRLMRIRSEPEELFVSTLRRSDQADRISILGHFRWSEMFEHPMEIWSMELGISETETQYILRCLDKDRIWCKDLPSLANTEVILWNIWLPPIRTNDSLLQGYSATEPLEVMNKTKIHKPNRQISRSSS